MSNNNESQEPNVIVSSQYIVLDDYMNSSNISESKRDDKPIERDDKPIERDDNLNASNIDVLSTTTAVVSNTTTETASELELSINSLSCKHSLHNNILQPLSSNEFGSDDDLGDDFDDLGEEVKSHNCDDLDFETGDSLKPAVDLKPIVCIIGAIGSGKTFVSNYISAHYNFSERNFAEPIKQIATAFGFNKNHTYGNQIEKMIPDPYWKISPREFLEKFGTEVCRNSLPNVFPNMDKVWVKIMHKHVLEIFEQDKFEGVVVGDCRFEDEAKMLKSCKAVIIKLKLSDELKNANNAVQTSHSSNTSFEHLPYDHLVTNDKTTKLFDQIDEIMKKHMIEKTVVSRSQQPIVKVNETRWQKFKKTLKSLCC
jgi:hypothetical protein